MANKNPGCLTYNRTAAETPLSTGKYYSINRLQNEMSRDA